MTKPAWPVELQGELWMMERRALEAFVAKVADASQAARTQTSIPQPAADRGLAIESDGTAVLEIQGTLMKTVPWYYEWYGIAATAYPELQADLEAALADPAVKAIRLEVDSPGGSSMGLKSVADALFAARAQKPLYARVNDLAASAAYWLASQAPEISAGPMANIGSIGAFITVVDFARMAQNAGIEVDVISSGPLKGAGAPGTSLTPEQRADLQKYVDDVTTQFIQDVARGRGIAEAKVRSWATGGLWLAEQAQKMGLVDQVESTQEMTARRQKAQAKAAQGAIVDGARLSSPLNIFVPKNKPADVPPAASSADAEKKEETMADPKVVDPKAADDAVAAERKRAADITAAFPGEPDFARAQIEKGSTLIEAKAAHHDLLTTRLAQETEKRTQAEARAEKAERRPTSGADPLPAGGDPGAGAAAPGFMEAAAEYREKQGFTFQAGRKVYNLSMTDAMKHVVRTQPELHKAFLKKCAQDAPRVDARKKALGMVK